MGLVKQSVQLVGQGWLPALLLILGAILFAVAGTIVAPGLQAGQLGPWFWPRLMLFGLMACCVARLVTLARGPRAARPRAASAESVAAEAAPPARVLAASIGLVLGYVLMTDLIGFTLATFGFLVAFVWVAGWRRPVALPALAVVGTVSLLYLFVKVVYLPLPRGQGVVEDLTIALYRLLGIF